MLLTESLCCVRLKSYHFFFELDTLLGTLTCRSGKPSVSAYLVCRHSFQIPDVLHCCTSVHRNRIFPSELWMENIRCARTEVYPFPVLHTTSTPPRSPQLYYKSQISNYKLLSICGLINNYGRTSGYVTLRDAVINERKPSWPTFRYYSSSFLDEFRTTMENLAYDSRSLGSDLNSPPWT